MDAAAICDWGIGPVGGVISVGLSLLNGREILSCDAVSKSIVKPSGTNIARAAFLTFSGVA